MEIIKIYGPPGTGKTTTLISTVEKELQNGIAITEVAYLTHTRAGAEEVRKRIGELFYGLTAEDLLWFRTIHSACCKMSGISARETISRSQREMFEARYGYKLEGTDARDGLSGWDRALDVLSMATAQQRDAEEVRREYGIPKRPFELFVSKWQQFKKDIGMLDFTDQLNAYDGTPCPVKIMIVDEAQDLSKKQWEIIFGLAGDCERMYVAGDDDQSIYSFIGADEYGFLDLEADEEIVLTKSYRVPRNIGAFAQNIIAPNKKRREKKVEWADHEGVIARIGGLEHFDFHRDDEVFVLCRHNKQCRQVSKHLRQKGIAHSVNGVSVLNDPKAHVAKTFILLSADEEVTPLQAARLADHLGEKELAREMRKLHKLRRPNVSRQHMPDINFDPTDWRAYLSQNRGQREFFKSLAALLNKYMTLEIIGQEPLVHVMTYHYSKGREADTVVCMTDVYRIVWEALLKKPDVERRLAYVGATRAKKNLVIVRPNTIYRFLPLLG